MEGEIRIEHDRVCLGVAFWLSLQRTLRVPDDGRPHLLPVSLGRLPLVEAATCTEAPASWRVQRDLIVPLYRREALWLGFDAPSWRPRALKVGAGGINVVTGEPLSKALSGEPQDYLVCPPQLWVDGINTGPNQVRQFVAMPLRLGVTIDEQLGQRGSEGTIEVWLYEPQPGRFPEQPPPPAERPEALHLPHAGGLGLAPGGRIRQKLYADPHGVATWCAEPSAAVTLHIVHSLDFKRLTGRPAPASPIDAETYRSRGLPWLDLYDEHLPAVAGSARLSGLEPVPADDGAELREPQAGPPA